MRNTFFVIGTLMGAFLAFANGSDSVLSEKKNSGSASSNQTERPPKQDLLADREFAFKATDLSTIGFLQIITSAMKDQLRYVDGPRSTVEILVDPDAFDHLRLVENQQMLEQAITRFADIPVRITSGSDQNVIVISSEQGAKIYLVLQDAL